jgi:hypothetical protein
VRLGTGHYLCFSWQKINTSPSLKFHIVCTCSFFGDTICLLTNRKVTLIDSHFGFTYMYDCWHCFLFFNIWVNNALEMTINFYYPTLELFCFSFTQPFTHSQNFVYPTLFFSVPINNDRSLIWTSGLARLPRPRLKEARSRLPGCKFLHINTHKRASPFTGMKIQRYRRELFLTTVKTMSKQLNCPGKRDEIFSNKHKRKSSRLPGCLAKRASSPSI